MRTINNRILGLDLFRAIAIILVVHSHGKFLLKDFGFEFLTILNVDGVELFFVLSGFLIGTILIKLLNNNKLNSSKQLFHFWKRRWFRTLPNYYLFLILNLSFVSWEVIDGNMENFNLSFLFFFHNFSHGFFGFYWESWSLSVEEYFYIFLPVILFLFRKTFSNKKTILFSIILLILLPLAYRVSISSLKVDTFWWDVEFRKTVLTRLDAIMYGVLMAFINIYHNNFFKRYASLMLIVGLLLLIILSQMNYHPNSFYLKTFYFSLQSFSVMLLLPKATQILSLGNIWIDKFIVFISNISYSMYLVNLLIAQIIMKQVDVTIYKTNFFVYMMYWILSISISYLIFKYFEYPITQLRERK